MPGFLGRFLLRLVWRMRMPGWLAARLFGLGIGAKPVKLRGPWTKAERKARAEEKRAFEESMRGDQ